MDFYMLHLRSFDDSTSSCDNISEMVRNYQQNSHRSHKLENCVQVRAAELLDVFLFTLH